jgi:hypothetical protein
MCRSSSLQPGGQVVRSNHECDRYKPKLLVNACLQHSIRAVHVARNESTGPRFLAEEPNKVFRGNYHPGKEQLQLALVGSFRTNEH